MYGTRGQGLALGETVFSDDLIAERGRQVIDKAIDSTSGVDKSIAAVMGVIGDRDYQNTQSYKSKIAYQLPMKLPIMIIQKTVRYI